MALVKSPPVNVGPLANKPGFVKLVMCELTTTCPIATSSAGPTLGGAVIKPVTVRAPVSVPPLSICTTTRFGLKNAVGASFNALMLMAAVLLSDNGGVPWSIAVTVIESTRAVQVRLGHIEAVAEHLVDQHDLTLQRYIAGIITARHNRDTRH